MMLGKRSRPPMKRTTSMTEFTLNDPFTGTTAALVLDPHNPFNTAGSDYRPTSARPSRRSSADFVETASFLRACSLCEGRLIPGRDIYMYKGDSAFCSLECRQQQMAQDERKDKKCSLASNKVEPAAATTSAVETVAAAAV